VQFARGELLVVQVKLGLVSANLGRHEHHTIFHLLPATLFFLLGAKAATAEIERQKTLQTGMNLASWLSPSRFNPRMR
jgi:hypothetical protein